MKGLKPAHETPMNRPETRYYDFGPFRLDAVRRLLLRDGEPVGLTSKAFDTLLELVRASGEVVPKDALLGRVWPDTAVEEKNLTVTISALRKSLGETPQDHRYIVTMPGRGYRFVADVTRSDDEADVTLVLESRSTSRVLIEVETDGDERVGGTAEPRALPPSLPPRSLAIATGLLAMSAVILTAVYFAVSTGGPRPGIGSRIHSLAVLPFKPLTAGIRDESLELGMADTLITRLSYQRTVTVRPISAVRQYSAVDQDALAAGRELNVEAVLDGSIQRAGDRVRVNVRLLRVSDGEPLWAGRLDEKFTDIFALQDTISERIASALALELNGDERNRMTRRYTENTEAYVLYLKGRYLWSRQTKESLKKSVEYFERAVEADPSFAPAFAGLADAYHSMVYWGGYPPREYMPKAKAAAVRALEIDDSLAEAHTSLAIVLEDYEWKFAEAEREYRQAIALNPNYAFARQRFGQLLAEGERFDESRAEHQRALDIDPVSVSAHMSYAALLYFLREYDPAIEQLHRTLELAPDYQEAYGLLGVIYREKGMYREAVDAWLRDRDSEQASVLRSAFERSGMKGYLRKDTELGRNWRDNGGVPPIFLAMEHAYLGERDEAFAILEAAYAERHSWLGEMRVEPAWDNLRPDPRFADLLGRVGLAS